ncbi:MAG TPA: VOC family protein [Victivallales bacterium]|nr:VOC family protein [Victivallales bacterium]
MTENSQKSKIYAVVIRTKNVEKLRNFYRDIIDLGPPNVDSNYWTEFKLGPDTNLVIELIDEESEGKGLEAKNTVDWAIRIENLDAEKERLKQANMDPVGEESDRFGKRVIKYLDPDGNIIHLISEKE